ncbi:AraC family transcriptional regulator [Arcobacter sp. HD9-500m-PIT-SAG03]|nr:AraC family transcriptional regulator [Arcobacter sp. HD9-500m-PIT-SAG03]
MKKMTIQEHKVRINEVLYHIYTNLSTKFSIDELAKISSYSPFHFQRIFKELTQKSVITYIKEARLEWAANLLIFNPESTITEIAHTCGLKSSATFTNEFKKYYEMTPSLWRKNGYKIHKNCETSKIKKEVDFSTIEIKKIENIQIAYMRHLGYDTCIMNTWQKFLYLLEKDYQITNPKMIGFHHSNPSITCLKDCRYGACIEIPNDKIQPKGDIGTGMIAGGLFASIKYQGEYNDVLHLYKKMYYEWLPSSEFEAINGKAHVIYHKNHFIEKDGKFDIEFRIPITYK